MSEAKEIYENSKCDVNVSDGKAYEYLRNYKDELEKQNEELIKWHIENYALLLYLYLDDDLNVGSMQMRSNIDNTRKLLEEIKQKPIEEILKEVL